MEAVTGVAVPLLTFVLGVVVTLIVNKYEQRRAIRRQQAEEVSKLINDWYNQLHDISVNMRRGLSENERTNLIHFYVHNRLVLPKVLFSLEVLKKHKDCNVLVNEVERFLEMVTTYRGRDRALYQCVFCHSLDMKTVRNERKLLSESDASSVYLEKIAEAPRLALDDLLTELDVQLQKVTREAAKLTV